VIEPIFGWKVGLLLALIVYTGGNKERMNKKEFKRNSTGSEKV
jgi:hypothetical protein